MAYVYLVLNATVVYRQRSHVTMVVAHTSSRSVYISSRVTHTTAEDEL